MRAGDDFNSPVVQPDKRNHAQCHHPTSLAPINLQAVASLGPFENVADFYAPNIVIQEFPNHIALQGSIRRAAELRAAYEQGCKILQSQIYAVHRIFEAGDEVVAELEWTGILAVPVMNLPAAVK